MDGIKSIQSCVSMPVEFVDKYEDKDEDVDQTRTVRPVGGQQSTQGGQQSTQEEEIRH